MSDTSNIPAQDFALDNQLCFAIYNANLWFGRFYQQALKPYGLTYTQYLILLALWENGQMNLHELGDALSLNSNTLTPLLRRMEEGGWILRLRPQKDRRQLIVQLTEKGAQSRQEIEGRVSVCIMHGIPGHGEDTPTAEKTAANTGASLNDPTAVPAPDLEAFRRILDDSRLLVAHLKKIVN
jgi:DNA-binding MarR family transcriptional regulator